MVFEGCVETHTLLSPLRFVSVGVVGGGCPNRCSAIRTANFVRSQRSCAFNSCARARAQRVGPKYIPPQSAQELEKLKEVARGVEEFESKKARLAKATETMAQEEPEVLQRLKEAEEKMAVCDWGRGL